MARTPEQYADQEHDISRRDAIERGVNADALIASGLWRWAPDQDRLIRTPDGLAPWWRRHGKE